MNLSRARTTFVVGAAAVLVLSSATAAQAHVRVDGVDATPGSEAVLTFRVPTESDTASTVGLRVTFPSTTPVAEVDTQPLAGWTARVVTAKAATPIQTDDGPVSDYVTSVTWRATGTGTPPEEFQEFNVVAGPLPDVSTLAFPTLQTYSDGSTVNWDEVSADGTTEPDHPVPVLTLTSASGAATAGPTAAPSGPTVTATDTGSGSGPSSWPGWVGLAAGLLALVVVGADRLRRGRQPSSGA